MNAFDNVTVDENSFANRDLRGIDRWDSFPVSTNLVIVGTPTYVGRSRVVGRQRFFQSSIVSSTSIASTAGTHYVALPTPAKGLGGQATMTNATTKIAVGDCHIDTSVSPARAYLPSQVASGDTFIVAGWYEIG